MAFIRGHVDCVSGTARIKKILRKGRMQIHEWMTARVVGHSLKDSIKILLDTDARHSQPLIIPRQDDNPVFP